MPIIKITKAQLKEAAKAHAAALKEGPDFKAFHEELERQEREAIEQLEKERE
jgi:hypothetical protein